MSQVLSKQTITERSKQTRNPSLDLFYILSAGTYLLLVFAIILIEALVRIY